jgi:hypothetical protein
MYDNKIRLSQDVLKKAELIAQEWGLKNARAAVEAVFRKYADDYLERHSRQAEPKVVQSQPLEPVASAALPPPSPEPKPASDCDALNALDDLLGL